MRRQAVEKLGRRELARKVFVWGFSFLILTTVTFIQAFGFQATGPERWEESIRRFEAVDEHELPLNSGLMFVGSSSIRLWDTSKYFSEYPTRNRGFGGSKIPDVLHYLPRIVGRHQPQVIVFYSGDNDIASGRTASQVVEDYAKFLREVSERLPETRVVYVPIKPSLKRWEKWPAMREANQQIRALCEQDERWNYADTATPMLTPEGTPRPELFARDGLHLSPDGYALWSEILRSHLEQLTTAGRLTVALRGEEDSQRTQAWSDSLRFYASFDDGADADYARGDVRAYTAPDINRQEVRPGLHVPQARVVADGRWGGALRFGPKTEEILFYRGAENLPYSADGFAGTISLWMSLDPDKELEPGFVDPLQITDKAWNNACFFLDFSKDETPRHFRLGVFSDYAFWNPHDRQWEAIPEGERPMVTVRQPPFRSGTWTHVAFTYDRFNRPGDANATLYLDGRKIGSLTGPQKFTWNPDDVAIMLGIYYTGLIDELAIFDRAFTEDEVKQLAGRTDSLREILPRKAD